VDRICSPSIKLPGTPLDSFLACRLLYKLAKKDRAGEKMKFYIASYSGSASEGMNYKAHGNGNDLYLHFPELRKIINRYPFKTIDFRLANGDRLRIYDINKNKSLNNYEVNKPISVQKCRRRFQ
jgi:hypothetical protein